MGILGIDAAVFQNSILKDGLVLIVCNLTDSRLAVADREMDLSTPAGSCCFHVIQPGSGIRQKGLDL